VPTCAAAQAQPAGGSRGAFKAGAITGLLVAGLALLGVTIYFWMLIGPLGLKPDSRCGRCAGGARLWRVPDLDLRADWAAASSPKALTSAAILSGKVEAGIGG
jgi:K(+)-stimulated pyrophosphate-energized sodium pump